jgi:hypothetical protein
MTDEEIELQNAKVKKAMCYELMELCLTTDPALLFGADAFEKTGGLEKVFRYIDTIYTDSDDAFFYDFYNKAILAAKRVNSEGPDSASGPVEQEKHEELKTLCAMAYQQLTPKQQKLFLQIDFDEFRTEVETRYKDGSLLPYNILGFLLHTINTFARKR